MLKTLPVLSAAIALSTALAFAQGPGTPPDPQTIAQMRVNSLTTQLSLTDAQKTTALSTYTNAYTAGRSVQSSLQTNRQSISDAVKANNTAAIDQLSLASGTLNGQLTAINFKAEAAFYAILTTDQQKIYATLPPGGGRGGPGGPTGPPPGAGPNARFGRGRE
ncbi:MAG TPA: Spy/CpxP family protein refolding chaperone [Bryobacteraceae bacterium]|nr:Spy/CpxP family protein refolding chaperone [Bryobacteraceae bacterium]